MPDTVPILCIPGLACSARLYAQQLPQLWEFGPVSIAQHTRHRSMRAIAAAILADAPPRFALIGLSMGGYVSFEILRQAPERVVQLALLDTSARPDTATQTANRRAQIDLATRAPLTAIVEAMVPRLVHETRRNDPRLREIFRLMAAETGAEGFIRQQGAIMNRVDSRPDLGAIRCPTLVLVGEDDELTPPPIAAEIANGISHARLVRIPDCGHLSTLEQPAAVTEALVDWLRTAG